MSLPTQEQAFATGGAVFSWPEDQEVIASAWRFNAINKALFGFIKQLETETGVVLSDHEGRITSAASTLAQHIAALADRYTKAEADAITGALGDSVAAVQLALDNLNALYQTDTEAAAALAQLSAQWDSTSSDFQSTVTGWMNDRYTKTETNTLLAQKADKTQVYTYQEVDALLTGKAAANHNHTLHIGNGSVEMFTLGTQERLNIKAGAGINLGFDAATNTIEVKIKSGLTWNDLAVLLTIALRIIIFHCRTPPTQCWWTLAALPTL